MLLLFVAIFWAQDNSGLTAIETLACGIPCCGVSLAFRLRSLVRHHFSGWKVLCNDWTLGLNCSMRMCLYRWNWCAADVGVMTESTDLPHSPHSPHPPSVDTLIVHWNRVSYQILEHRSIARQIQLVRLKPRPRCSAHQLDGMLFVHFLWICATLISVMLMFFIVFIFEARICFVRTRGPLPPKITVHGLNRHFCIEIYGKSKIKVCMLCC